MGSLGGSISSSTCSPISAHFSYVNPTHFHLTGPSGPSSLSESRVPVLSPIYPPTPSSSSHFPPHPHLHPLHPLNHPIHHRLPLPIHIQNGQNCLVQVLPHPKAQMFNGQQEVLGSIFPQLMPLHPAMMPSLHPIFQQTPYAISSAFKPYLTQTPNPTNNQNFFYFPPTPTESHADSEDDKSQASSESEIIPQMDCPKLEAQPSMSLEG
ncbi:unnamed protein product, partial [Mesorhabditis belari]|uniref:Uncharacterized protein n=1 Tax=Mesorhabditis belari TaxID=2138241 RepID=A0AAF3J256_9BILA